MANSPNTQTNLDGLLKPRFGELQEVIPQTDLLQNLIDFDAANAVGADFEEPVVLQSGGGLTFLGTNPVATTLNDSQPLTMKLAKIVPAELIHRGQVITAMVDKALGGNTSYEKSIVAIANDMNSFIRRNIEITLLCGQDGIMEVQSYDATGNGTVTFTDASLRPGFLHQLENYIVDFQVSGSTSLRSNSGGLKIAAVNTDNKTATFSASPSTAPQAGDKLFLHGGSNGDGTYMEMVGFRKQIATQTGTVFNIDKASFSMWRGSVAPNFGPVSQGSMTKLASKLGEKSFTGTAVAIVSPKRWAALASKIANQAIITVPTLNPKVGFKAIQVVDGAVTLEILAHPFQADGEIMLLPKENVRRIGTVYKGDNGGDGKKDVTFQRPGGGEQFFEWINSTNYWEMQCRSDQQGYLSRPSWGVLATGVTD